MPHREKPKAGESKVVYVAEAGLAGGAGARLRRGAGMGRGGRGRGRANAKLQPKHLGARGGDVVGGGRLVYQKTRGPIAYFGDPKKSRKQLVVDEERGVHLHRIKRVGQSTRYMHYRHGTRGFGAAKEAVLAAKAAARVANAVANTVEGAVKYA